VHVGPICDDHNACTTDSCDPVTGKCVSHRLFPVLKVRSVILQTAPVLLLAPPNEHCNDNNACSTDICESGLCKHGPVGCISPLCETAACDPAIGCVRTPIDCDDNNACTADSCDPAIGCVHTNICPTGSDVGIARFRVPSNIKACRNVVPIQIKVRNYGTTNVTGTIALKKGGIVVKSWNNVLFRAGENVNKNYLYNPRGKGEDTIPWSVEVIVPDDPNSSNNSSQATMYLMGCKVMLYKHNNGRGNGHGSGHGITANSKEQR